MVAAGKAVAAGMEVSMITVVAVGKVVAVGREVAAITVVAAIKVVAVGKEGFSDKGCCSQALRVVPV